MDKYLLLTAKEYNTWFEISSGWEWEATSWRIYSDKSYRMTLTFRPTWENEGKRKRLRWQSGIIDTETFDELLKQLAEKDWGEPDRRDDIDDGPLWKIRQYSSTGQLIGSSGKLNFIVVKDRPLDRIIGCLPEPHDVLLKETKADAEARINANQQGKNALCYNPKDSRNPDVAIIEKIKKVEGCGKLNMGVEVDVRQANSWKGYDYYVLSYLGGALGGMRFYQIIDGEPMYIPSEEVMQMLKDGYYPWGNKEHEDTK